jgi:hypothetical protein
VTIRLPRSGALARSPSLAGQAEVCRLGKGAAAAGACERHAPRVTVPRMVNRRRRLGDRRTRPRFEVVGQLWADFETLEPLTLRDVGRGGALVASRLPLPPESIQHLRFTFRGTASDFHASSPWCKSGVAPRRVRRPAGQARRPRISGIFEGGATQPGGRHRPPNAAGLSPRAARVRHVRLEGEGDGALYLVGLEFLPLPEEAALEIERLVESHSAPAGAPGGQG